MIRIDPYFMTWQEKGVDEKDGLKRVAEIVNLEMVQALGFSVQKSIVIQVVLQ